MNRPHPSLEFQILLACGGTDTRTSRVEVLSELLREDVDWKSLVNLSIGHGLFYFLYETLKKLPEARVPDEISAEMKRIYQKGYHHSLNLSQSLLRILAFFRLNHIDALPVKGTLQSELIYHNANMRSFSDLDILVMVEDADKARGLLSHLGFQADIDIPEEQWSHYLKNENFFHSPTGQVPFMWIYTGNCLGDMPWFPFSSKTLKGTPSMFASWTRQSPPSATRRC